MNLKPQFVTGIALTGVGAAGLILRASGSATNASIGMIVVGVVGLTIIAALLFVPPRRRNRRL